MPAPDKRLYKHVLYKKPGGHTPRGGWVAQVPADGKQKTVGGIHKTQHAAAATAAKFLKVQLTDLRLERPVPLPSCGAEAAVSSNVQQSSSPAAGRKKKGIKKAASLKKYVYKQGARFRVAVGSEYVGCFATAAAAAEAAADYAKKHGLAPALKEQNGVKPGELLKRLKAGLKVFHGYEPPYLENLAVETQLSSSVWPSEPALPFLCALGKYGPWREKLRARAETRYSPGPTARLWDLKSRTAELLDVLKGTVEDMQTTAWHLT